MQTSVIACETLKKFNIMYYPKDLKINKLVQVVIPRGKDIFKLNQGILSIPPDSAYSGEMTAQGSLTKIEEIEALEAYASRMQKEASKSE